MLVILLFLAELLLGSVNIPLAAVWKTLTGHPLKDEWLVIITEFRLPKAITGLLAGAGLAVSGLQMQTIFRNPMAGPYVLGISSGASLGVALLLMGAGTFAANLDIWKNLALSGAAWVGSFSILLLILAVSFRLRNVVTILILGMMFGAGISAIVNILQYFSPETEVKAFVVWTMGSLNHVTLSHLKFLSPVIIASLLMAFSAVKILNLFLLGENQAKSLGLSIKRSRILVFISTSMLAGSITAFCGPIAFLGIATPHITRMIFKTADHKLLLPGSALTGSATLMISDLIAQLPGYQENLPLNSVASLIGIPVVIWVIFKNQSFGDV